MVWIRSSAAHFFLLTSSFWRVLGLMKFPADPESMSAKAEIQDDFVTMYTRVLTKVEIGGGNWMVLTTGRGGRTG